MTFPLMTDTLSNTFRLDSYQKYANGNYTKKFRVLQLNINTPASFDVKFSTRYFLIMQPST